MIACPCCGGELSEAGFLILADRSLVIRGDATAHLTGKEFEVFKLLFDRRPKVMSKEIIFAALYDLSNEEVEIKIVDVYVCKINKKIKPLGVSVLNSWGKGYWLNFEAEVPVRIVEAA